ncbi:MAG: leucine-rich repeat protein, partial [Ruminococcus sp.]|nr:leucine-rich repeat protein [Ruminococcus sp.]
QRMFSGCSSLSSVLFAGDITEVSYYTFESCASLKKISLPDSVTHLREHAFSGCKSLERFTLPADTVGIDLYAFFGCKNMRTFTANSVLRTIGNQAFTSCESLIELNFPATLTSVGEHAFSGCSSLVGIDISALAAAPGKYVFNGCYSLTAFPTLNASITAIVEGMFSECYGLESVTIPSHITQINTAAFYNCKNLSRVDLRQLTQVPALADQYIFISCSNIQFIVRDEQQKADFRSATNWSSFADSKYVIEVMEG